MCNHNKRATATFKPINKALPHVIAPVFIEKEVVHIPQECASQFTRYPFPKKTWEGKEWKEQSGAKLTRAQITNAYQGELQGEGKAQLLMVYRDDNFASYTGLEQITGQLGGRSGSFVLQVNGVYEESTAKTSWIVAHGSGTGELRGLRGEGSYLAKHGDQAVPFTLDYDFE